MEGPRVQELSGGRLHLHHGPIDIVLKAWGPPADVHAAYRAAAERFASILGELVAELPELRRDMAATPRVDKPVACRMVAAAARFPGVFLTPMAAVAGSVADELRDLMCAAAALDRLYVNDGGDIAVHLGPGQSLRLGIAGEFTGRKVPRLNGAVTLRSGDGIGGIATSGFQGRSFSFGIADSVTVLAATAAIADVAATLIANAVTVESPAIRRAPADTLDPDTDLGNRLVTVAVGELTSAEIAAALDNGCAIAEAHARAGRIVGATLMLRGEVRTVSPRVLTDERALAC